MRKQTTTLFLTGLLLSCSLFYTACDDKEDPTTDPRASVCESPSDVIAFIDANMERVVRLKLKKTTGDITCGELSAIRSLNAQGAGIQSLADLVYFSHLDTLNVALNPLTDKAILADLPLKKLIEDYPDSHPIVFKDATLEQELRLDMKANLPSFAEKPDTEPITYGEAKRMTKIHLPMSRTSSIFYLNGLEFFTNVDTLEISSQALKDITPLVNFPGMKFLSLAKCTLADLDLSPLALLNDLEVLNLWSCSLDDISFLKNKQKLDALFLMQNNVQDLTPLTGLQNLTQLFLTTNYFIDNTTLGALQTLPKLERLGLMSCGVNDEGLRKMLTGMRNDRPLRLDLANNDFTDLTPFNSAQLDNIVLLDLTRCNVSDLRPLKNLKTLESLFIINTSVTSLDGMQQMANLQELDAQNDNSSLLNIGSLAPIANSLKLKSLNLSYSTTLTDIEPLANMTELESLTINNCSKVNSIEPLRGCLKLESVAMTQCPLVPSLAPLYGKPLLRTVMAQGCTLITSQDRNALRASIPGIRVFPMN